MGGDSCSFAIILILLVGLILFLVIISSTNKKRSSFTSSQDKDPGFTFYHPIDTRYWPQDYYSFPYNYGTSGAWPPGMYTRMDKWYPGFITSGWGYTFRPGMGYKAWPRSRWVRQDGSHYYINNGVDRSGDYYGVSPHF